MSNHGRLASLWLAACTFFAAIVLLLGGADILDAMRSGRHPDVLGFLSSYAFGLLPWLPLSVFVFSTARAGALARASFWGTSLRTGVTAVACAAAILGHIFFIQAPILDVPGEVLVNRVPVILWTFDVFFFGLCLAAGRADGERTLKERTAAERSALNARLLELEREAATLDAREIRLRFSSHFVLNALSNILGLVRNGEQAAAESAILAFGEILKRVGRAGGASMSTVEQELEFLSAYLQFQRIRYPNAIVDVDVDARAREAYLPAFLLQPLIENVFKHGLSGRGNLAASLTVRVLGERLAVSVTNSLPPSVRPGFGSDGEGLALTHARLELAYAQDYEVSRGVENGRHFIRIDLPAAYAHDRARSYT
jgi:hypothetical protein